MKLLRICAGIYGPPSSQTMNNLTHIIFTPDELYLIVSIHVSRHRAYSYNVIT